MAAAATAAEVAATSMAACAVAMTGLVMAEARVVAVAGRDCQVMGVAAVAAAAVAAAAEAAEEEAEVEAEVVASWLVAETPGRPVPAATGSVAQLGHPTGR